MIKKFRKKKIIGAIVFLSAVGIWVLYFARSGPVDYPEALGRILEESGEARLGLNTFLDLPYEFYIYEHLQRARGLGFETAWRGDRYLVVNQKTGQVNDPFLPNRGLPERIGWRKIKVDSILKRCLLDYRILGFVYHEDPYQELYRYSLTARKTRSEDEESILDRLIVRDDAIRFNIYSRITFVSEMAESEARCEARGFIMEKGERYSPIMLESKRPLAFPDRVMVVRDAFRVLNETSVKFGNKFFLDYHGPMLRQGPLDFGIAAIEILKLHDVRVHWNESSQKYDMASGPAATSQ